jgi:hypothetical protein
MADEPVGGPVARTDGATALRVLEAKRAKNRMRKKIRYAESQAVREAARAYSAAYYRAKMADPVRAEAERERWRREAKKKYQRQKARRRP